VGAIVCARRYWANGRHDTLSQNIAFRVLMSIKIETLKSEHERAAETDVFRPGDTACTQKLTPHTGYKLLRVYIALPY
jgi:hypothetical protein